MEKDVVYQEKRTPKGQKHHSNFGNNRYVKCDTCKHGIWHGESCYHDGHHCFKFCSAECMTRHLYEYPGQIYKSILNDELIEDMDMMVHRGHDQIILREGI